MNKQTKILNRQNNELDKKLVPENQTIMTDMVCYLRVANISDYDQELVRHDLLEIVLSAQERGEEISAVIGDDYKQFCDEIIASLPEKSKKSKWLDFVDTIMLCLSVLGLIHLVLSKDSFQVFKHLITGKKDNFMISFTIGDIISYVIILAASFAIVHYIGKTSFKSVAQNTGRVKRFIVGGAIGVGIMGGFILINALGRQTMFQVHVIALCIVTLCMYAGHKILQNYVQAK